jgi:hypothetical protein
MRDINQQNIINSTVHGSVVVNMGKCKIIVGSQPEGEKKGLLELLQSDIAKVMAAQTDNDEKQKTADALKVLLTQATAAKSDRRLYSMSSEGLIEASKTSKNSRGTRLGRSRRSSLENAGVNLVAPNYPRNLARTVH